MGPFRRSDGQPPADGYIEIDFYASDEDLDKNLAAFWKSMGTFKLSSTAKKLLP